MPIAYWQYAIGPKNVCDPEPHNLTEVWTQIKKKRRPREREERYPDFRWVSPCGPETNFIKVDLVPIVWQKIEVIDGIQSIVDTSGTFTIKFQKWFLKKKHLHVLLRASYLQI